jgi:hypothetical protein
MMSDVQVVAWRDDLTRSLDDWNEPDGVLIMSQPNPVEREKCRDRLRVAIEVLTRVLDC